jgi:hypothetical protein
VSDAKPRLPADLRRPGPKRCASAPRPQLDQRRADADRYGKSGTEPTLDEMLREPAIRLIMRRDNVTEDQLLRLIKLVRCFQNNAPMGSCCIVDFVAPSVDYWLAIDVADEGDQAFLEFVFAADADVAQHRTRQLGEEALDEIEP